jgi:hypothetical protein
MRRRQDAYLSEMQNERSLGKKLAGKQTALSQFQNTLQQLPIITAQRVSQLEANIAELEVRLKEAEASFETSPPLRPTNRTSRPGERVRRGATRLISLALGPNDRPPMA